MKTSQVPLLTLREQPSDIISIFTTSQCSTLIIESQSPQDHLNPHPFAVQMAVCHSMQAADATALRCKGHVPGDSSMQAMPLDTEKAKHRGSLALCIWGKGLNDFNT